MAASAAASSFCRSAAVFRACSIAATSPRTLCPQGIQFLPGSIQIGEGEPIPQGLDLPRHRLPPAAGHLPAPPAGWRPTPPMPAAPVPPAESAGPAPASPQPFPGELLLLRQLSQLSRVFASAWAIAAGASSNAQESRWAPMPDGASPPSAPAGHPGRPGPPQPCQWPLSAAPPVSPAPSGPFPGARAPAPAPPGGVSWASRSNRASVQPRPAPVPPSTGRRQAAAGLCPGRAPPHARPSSGAAVSAAPPGRPAAPARGQARLLRRPLGRLPGRLGRFQLGLCGSAFPESRAGVG